MSRRPVPELVEGPGLGGDIYIAISNRTNIVMVGRAPWPSKMRNIDALLALGCDTQVMERSFYDWWKNNYSDI